MANGWFALIGWPTDRQHIKTNGNIQQFPAPEEAQSRIGDSALFDVIDGCSELLKVSVFRGTNLNDDNGLPIQHQKIEFSRGVAEIAPGCDSPVCARTWQRHIRNAVQTSAATRANE